MNNLHHTFYDKIAKAIIRAQEKIIGPIAYEQAYKVKGLTIGDDKTVHISGDEKEVLSDLVEKYEEVFGRASIEVCRDAVRQINPPIEVDSLPESLK